MTEIVELRPVYEWKNSGKSLVEATVVREVPLTIMLNGRELATLSCSPIAEKELVIGFLACEGLLRDPDDIKDYRLREEQRVAWVETFRPPLGLEESLRRKIAGCGSNSSMSRVKPVTGEVRFSIRQIQGLMQRLQEDSQTFKLTGGVHTAALADAERILVRYEDVGRHNALDRVLGHTFLTRTDTADKAVLLSGRIASEMLLKAARIGTPVVISKSAPTALALDQAEELGLTVVGFVRGERLSVYCHGERITD